MGCTRLREVFTRIDEALSAGVLPLVVFDLDSTLFSTAPRNWRILEEFVEEHGARPGLLDAFARMRPGDMGWNVHEDLRRFGFRDEEALALLKRFWTARFFTDAYVQVDEPVPGAPQFVEACHERGALIYYLTGRHVGGMELGTVQALQARGFPFWRGRCVLHLKPSFEMNDRAFKDDALADIRSYQGRVVATFENDPANANLFLGNFPDALHYLLLTVHPPDAPAPARELIQSTDFFLE